jgi:heat shock protein HtpX
MISGAHEVTKEEEPELYRIVENLTIGSGLPMPKVYVIEDSAPNALATGRDPQHAYVAATRGLLNKLEKRELEAVMAHEMSHVGNYDIRIMTMIAVAVGLIAMIADLLLRFTWYGAGARSGNRDKGGGAIALVLLWPPSC